MFNLARKKLGLIAAGSALVLALASVLILLELAGGTVDLLLGGNRGKVILQ